MKTILPLVVALCFLSACGDPLENVDKLSAVELAEDTGSVGALPDPTETARQGGLFSGLFGPRNAAPVANATDDAVSAALNDVEETATADLDTTADAALASAEPLPEPEPKPRGLFGIFARQQTQAPEATPQDVAALAPSEDTDTAPTVETALAVEPEKLLDVTATAPQAENKPRRGLFGLLSGARAKERAALADEPEEAERVVRTASLGAVIPPKETTQKQSLFNAKPRNHKGPDAQIVSFGTTLPSGVVARVCDLPRGRLGKQIEKFPQRGQGYKLYDSKPGSNGTRPFYVTGFDDNCARTFTAALALFGSPTMHEQLRYGLPSKVQPYSLTDKAYEGIKRSVCGVGKNKACGAKISKLEKNTVFVSIYDRIGSNAQWSNILIHEGWVLAADRKG